MVQLAELPETKLLGLQFIRLICGVAACATAASKLKASGRAYERMVLDRPLLRSTALSLRRLITGSPAIAFDFVALVEQVGRREQEKNQCSRTPKCLAKTIGI